MALFSGVEVKSESGNQAEAEVQVSVWMAASLRKKAKLAAAAERLAHLRGAEARDRTGGTDADDADGGGYVDAGNVDASNVDAGGEEDDMNVDKQSSLPAGDRKETDDTDENDKASAVNPLLSAMPEPAVIIVGHTHLVYYAYLGSGGSVCLLGPDPFFSKASTMTISGIFGLIRLYGRMLEYGMDEKGFGGHFLGQVLERLATPVDG
jgi:hypothetical protein